MNRSGRRAMPRIPRLPRRREARTHPRSSGGLVHDDVDGGAFDLWRARIGLFAGPATALLLWVRGDGSPSAHLAAVFALAGIWWVCESIPPALTALLAVALTVLLGVASAKESFAAFGNPILFLFVGSFMIAEAMNT